MYNYELIAHSPDCAWLGMQVNSYGVVLINVRFLLGKDVTCEISTPPHNPFRYKTIHLYMLIVISLLR